MIERTLWYEKKDGRRQVEQHELIGRPKSLIILGEAGMGKTFMLSRLRDAGAPFCTARQLANRPDPTDLLCGGRLLIIDALDEVPSKSEGDAVDRVLQKLGQLGYPRFILSCRAAEWRDASATEAIAEQYARAPLILHLRPFTDMQATKFLEQKVGEARARQIVDHYRDRGLEEFLGNPQTLEIIRRIPGKLPETRRALFQSAVDALWQETNDKKPVALDRQSTLDAAGAAFAGLLLTGNSAVVRKGAANLSEGEMPLAEIEAFDGGKVGAVLATRLFASVGSDGFSYWHRRIGEFLGAQWLAARADTRRKRRRLLALFRSNGLVPANLRNLHAWLAADPELAPDVIAADPMGVVEYGDADTLDDLQGRAMISALRALAEANPGFRAWGPYRAKGLVQPDLLTEVRALILAPETPFGLRALVLEQVQGSVIAADLATDLRALLLDENAYFAVRSLAGEALVKLDGNDWPLLIDTIRREATHDATRLASDLLDDIGMSEFSDEQIIEVIFAHAGLTLCAVPKEGANRLVGRFTRIDRALPDERLDGVLDRFADYARSLLERDAGYKFNELIDLGYALILRRAQLDHVDPLKLWQWLLPFREQSGYRRDNLEVLAAWFGTHDDARRTIQRHVLLDAVDSKTVWQRAWRLSARSTGLAPTPDDVIALLTVLDPADRSDERWRDVITLTRHNGDEGAAVRAAARGFALHRPDLLVWLDSLALPPVPEWQIKQDREQRRRAAKQAVAWAEHRRGFEENIELVKAGIYGRVVGPAQAYLKRFHDIGDGLPAHERVAHWLGPVVANAAHTGFEAFLTASPPKPNAVEISKGHADGRGWDAGFIIVAALAERWRTGRGFADLRAERLMAGLFELRRRIEQHAEINGLRNAIDAELRRRDKWRSALVLHFRPQFDRRLTHVDGLYELTRSEADETLAAGLAEAWLDRYPDMPGESEVELIDRLLRSGRDETLRRIGAARRLIALDDERRRNWDAV